MVASTREYHARLSTSVTEQNVNKSILSKVDISPSGRSEVTRRISVSTSPKHNNKCFCSCSGEIIYCLTTRSLTAARYGHTFGKLSLAIVIRHLSNCLGNLMENNSTSIQIRIRIRILILILTANLINSGHFNSLLSELEQFKRKRKCQFFITIAHKTNINIGHINTISLQQNYSIISFYSLKLLSFELNYSESFIKLRSVTYLSILMTQL